MQFSYECWTMAINSASILGERSFISILCKISKWTFRDINMINNGNVMQKGIVQFFVLLLSRIKCRESWGRKPMRPHNDEKSTLSWIESDVGKNHLIMHENKSVELGSSLSFLMESFVWCNKSFYWQSLMPSMMALISSEVYVMQNSKPILHEQLQWYRDYDGTNDYIKRACWY